MNNNKRGRGALLPRSLLAFSLLALPCALSPQTRRPRRDGYLSGGSGGLPPPGTGARSTLRIIETSE
jgi:hypothetical protein